MKLRQWIMKYPWIFTILVALVLYWVCSQSLCACSPPPVQLPVNVWFYDLETGQLFVAPGGLVPPIATPSGHKDHDGNDLGVRAVVFSCGRCDVETNRYIGYLEKFTPEAREQMQSALNAGLNLNDHSPPPPMTQRMGDPMMYGRLIASPVDRQWVNMQSPDSARIIEESMNKCGPNTYPKQCYPGIP